MYRVGKCSWVTLLQSLEGPKRKWYINFLEEVHLIFIIPMWLCEQLFFLSSKLWVFPRQRLSAGS
jgi:hypothetical protein